MHLSNPGHLEISEFCENVSWFVKPRNGGRTRDQLLEDLRIQYKSWIKRNKIYCSYVVGNRLFTSKILKPKTGEYPSVSQKVMKGAAARTMVNFCAEISYDYACMSNSQKDWPGPHLLIRTRTTLFSTCADIECFAFPLNTFCFWGGLLAYLLALLTFSRSLLKMGDLGSSLQLCRRVFKVYWYNTFILRPELDFDKEDPFELQCRLEDSYMLFRKCFQCTSAQYIRNARGWYDLLGFCSPAGLGHDAIQGQKCLWHFRPKIHQFEHLCLVDCIVPHACVVI